MILGDHAVVIIPPFLNPRQSRFLAMIWVSVKFFN